MPFLEIPDFRGGRNGVDPADSIANNECQDAVNVEWFHATLARRRQGCSVFASTAGLVNAAVDWLGRHIPADDESAAELWAVQQSSGDIDGDNAGTGCIVRYSGGSWSAPSFRDDTPLTHTLKSGVSFDGKFFLAFSPYLGIDRLHVWDGSTIRRTGIAAPLTAPTAADFGSGTYGAVLRYYRVRFTKQSGGITVLRSEPSPSVGFTPSGTGLVARITRPTVVNEGETHWEIEGSTDNVNFYLLAVPAIATTVVDEGPSGAITVASPALYSSIYTISPQIGTYTVQKAYKYIAADQNRLLGFGSYTSTDKQNRIEISAILGSVNVGDAERVDTTTGYYIDLDERDSGPATGLRGPMDGSFFAFKYRQIWMLTPSGDTATPYQTRCVSKRIGAVHHNAITMGEDEDGGPCLYFMSHRGPYRYGKNGLEYIGHGIEDLVLGPTSTINLSATRVVAHCVYHETKRQVWFWFTTGSNNYPDTLVVYNIGLRAHGIPSGWARHTGDIATAYASVSFSTTTGSTVSRDLSPYLAQKPSITSVNFDGTKYIWQCDTGNQDNGVSYQAYVRSKALLPWGPQMNGRLNRAWLIAQPLSGVSIQQTIHQDFDAQTARTSTVSLTAVGSETQVRRKFEDSAAQGVLSVDVQLGDASAVNVSPWRLDRYVVEYAPQEIG